MAGRNRPERDGITNAVNVNEFQAVMNGSNIRISLRRKDPPGQPSNYRAASNDVGAGRLSVGVIVTQQYYIISKRTYRHVPLSPLLSGASGGTLLGGRCFSGASATTRNALSAALDKLTRRSGTRSRMSTDPEPEQKDPDKPEEISAEGSRSLDSHC